jgi:hypothetical protein
MWPFRNRPPRQGREEVGFERPTRILSILEPEEIAALGIIPSKGMAGTFVAGSDTTAIGAFRPNVQFVEFLHEVIRTAGPTVPELIAMAANQTEGWVYVIDLRTPDGPHGRVPPEDIIGAFEVRLGKISADSYQPFSGHRVYTHNGLVTLPAPLREAFVARLKDAVDALP